MDNKSQGNEWILRLLCVVSSVLKQWRIIIIVVCLFAAVFDVIQTITYSPTYQSKAVVAILDGDGKGLDGDSTIKGNQTIQYFLNSSMMKKQVNQALGQNSFNGSIATSVTANTNLCTITVYSNTQKDAYFQLQKLLDIYQETSVRQSFGYYIQIVEDITFSNHPLNYNSHAQNYKKGLIVSFGMMVCCLGVFFYLKDNVKTPQMVNENIDAKLFAKIPKEIKKNQRFNFFVNKKTAILVSHFNTGFSYVESMNKLASKVEQVSNEHDYKTFLITSSLENEGKSSVAVNLAISLAKNKHKVLLVDGDMKKPALHKIFEKEVDKSLVDVLDKNESWQDCIVSLEREQIDVIFSCADDGSQEMLAEKFGEFINKVKEEYEYIIVDSAPSRYIQDTTMIASLCDATFVVVQQNNATCKVINDTIYYLVNNNANVIGTIYNASVFDFMKAQNSYGYRYGNYRYHRERGSK